MALSRFAVLRVPAEPLLLRRQDIDLATGRMLVHSPKTEHHAGKATRMVPIFSELRPYHEDAQELAAVGAEFVLPSLRKPGAATGDWRSVNLGTMFGKIIKRAGLDRMAPRVAQPQKLTPDRIDGDVAEPRRHGLARQQRADCREALPDESDRSLRWRGL